jgi:DNA polymerase III epsilon subunit-like protein
MTVDTLQLARALFPAWSDYSLEALAVRLDLPVTGRHTAPGDALLAAEVLVRLLRVLDLRAVTTLEGALRLQGAGRWQRLLGAARLE